MGNTLKVVFWFTVFLIVGLSLAALDFIIKLLALFAWLFCEGKVRQWGFNVWFASDNYFNAVLGGDSEETISSRLGKAQLDGSSWTYVADKVDLVAYEFSGELYHCLNSIEWDEGSEQVTGR